MVAAPFLEYFRAMPRSVTLLFLLLLTGARGYAHADTATVAVATNFVGTVEALVRLWEAHSEATLTIVSGSTGKLYAQIGNGAPYDAFLSADQARPLRLCEAGLADPDSRFTYARGRLSLWSKDPSTVRLSVDGIPQIGHLRSLAIANPALAPYGAAAVDVLRNLDLWSGVQDKLVMGENVGQAYALVATGNAEAGFVARTALVMRSPAGSRWDVPQSLHRPIRQDAVLLKHGRQNAVARDFLGFLASEPARRVIESHGYGLD